MSVGFLLMQEYFLHGFQSLWTACACLVIHHSHGLVAIESSYYVETVDESLDFQRACAGTCAERDGVIDSLFQVFDVERCVRNVVIYQAEYHLSDDIHVDHLHSIKGRHVPVVLDIEEFFLESLDDSA